MHESNLPAAALTLFLAFTFVVGPDVAFGEESATGSAVSAAATEAAATESAAAETVADSATETAEAVNGAEHRIPETLKHKDRAVMDVALDGSSLDSFNEGLARVEQEATPQEYRRLKSALDKLLFYDIGAKRNREVLYQRLSGKTPNQIIEQAGRR